MIDTFESMSSQARDAPEYLKLLLFSRLLDSELKATEPAPLPPCFTRKQLFLLTRSQTSSDDAAISNSDRRNTDQSACSHSRPR